MKFDISFIILLFSLIGIALTAFLIYQHYYAVEVCNINQFISCDVVNKSIYSEFFGIPVAALGLGYFAIIAILCQIKNRMMIMHIFFLSFIALSFSAYLTYVELFVLNALCIVCESTKAVMLAIILLSYFSWKGKLKEISF